MNDVIWCCPDCPDGTELVETEGGFGCPDCERLYSLPLVAMISADPPDYQHPDE